MELGLKYTIDKYGDFKLSFQLDDERTQVAFVLSNTSQLGTLEIRNIWSIGCVSGEPFSKELANDLLARNSKYKLGARQMLKMGDKYVAVFQIQFAANSDKKTLALALRMVCVAADEVEKTESSEDTF